MSIDLGNKRANAGKSVRLRGWANSVLISQQLHTRQQPLVRYINHSAKNRTIITDII